MIIDFAAYAGLFGTAFMAATILPSSSEVVLVGLLATEKYSTVLLLLTASAGNILGAILNYCLGRGIEHYRDRKWFPVSESSLARAQCWYEKWGRWSLLLSWVPLCGDALTIAAGVMHERLSIFILLVGIAKTMRYIAVAIAFIYFQKIF